MFHVSKFNLLIEELIGGVPGQEVYTPRVLQTDRDFPMSTAPHWLNKNSPDQQVEDYGFSWNLRHFEEALTSVSDFIVLWKLLSNVLNVFVYFGGWCEPFAPV